jgi:zeta-carotene desaturase
MLAIVRAAGKPPHANGASMLDWLHSMRQTKGAIERFWRVVLVSALDEELARTDAKYGIEVFWKGFLSNARGYRVGIPSVPLAELYEGCHEAIARRGGEVRLRSGVRRLCMQGDRFAGAILEDGTEMEADALIAAMPHDVLLNLMPREMAESGAPLEGLRHIKTSPITSVHFWFDRTVMTEPFLTLLDHTTQWIFNRTLLSSRGETNGASVRPTEQPRGDSATELRPATELQYLQLVISASYDLVPRSRAEIIDLCRRELADVLPATREAKVLKATVIKEINATFSPEPGVDRWRPAQTTPIGNLFLAGDWTQTGWPSTMEGAVRSGYLAAEAALKHFGQPAKLLQADLPVEGLCKFWSRQSASSAG